jgi:hypothetical protein
MRQTYAQRSTAEWLARPVNFEAEDTILARLSALKREEAH